MPKEYTDKEIEEVLDANIESVLENVDYNFEHEDIIRTEIVEVLN
jgi:hypothetical protein